MKNRDSIYLVVRQAAGAFHAHVLSAYATPEAADFAVSKANKYYEDQGMPELQCQVQISTFHDE